jgi:hypothetical protein
LGHQTLSLPALAAEHLSAVLHAAHGVTFIAVKNLWFMILVPESRMSSYDREIKFEGGVSFNTGFGRNYLKKFGSEVSTHIVVSFSMFSFAR